jgi:uncharacterized protein
LAAGCAAWSALAAPVCDPDAIFLRTPAGAEIRFSAEIADDADERAQGLMNRPSMAQSASMLFVFPAPRRVGFWMKNTLIPLDILFADEYGVVQRVHPMARPLDESVIDGGEAIRFVVEINGGLAGRLGIGPGTEIMHPSIDQAMAKWPCPPG